MTSLSLFTFVHWRRKWQPTPVFLPGESQGWGRLVGCHLWGHAESDTTEATQQQQQQQEKIDVGFVQDSSKQSWKSLSSSSFSLFPSPLVLLCLELKDGEGHANPLQYSCLENPIGRGASRATVHGVTKSQT